MPTQSEAIKEWARRQYQMKPPGKGDKGETDQICEHFDRWNALEMQREIERNTQEVWEQ